MTQYTGQLVPVKLKYLSKEWFILFQWKEEVAYKYIRWTVYPTAKKLRITDKYIKLKWLLVVIFDLDSFYRGNTLRYTASIAVFYRLSDRSYHIFFLFQRLQRLNDRTMSRPLLLIFLFVCVVFISQVSI